MSFIEAIYRESFRPEPLLTIAQWARQNVKVDSSSPIPGYYDVQNSPQMHEPLIAWQDESTRHILTLGPNQGGRTKAQEIACIWTAVFRQGPMQWNVNTNVKAEEEAEDRFWPMAEGCEEFMRLVPKSVGNFVKKKKTAVTFTNGMPFRFQGANESNAQQKTILNQFNDECFQWDPGMMDNFHKRTTAFPTSHKIWDGSTAGREGSELHQEWNESSRGEWMFCCRKCGRVQAFEWRQLRWDTNDITHPEGKRYNYAELAKTVRYVCENPECEEIYKDTYLERKRMNDSATYVHEDPLASVKGYRFNSLSVNFPGVKWASLVEEFLKAKAHYREYGDAKKLELFFSRRMVEFWEEARFLGNTKVEVKSDYFINWEQNEYISYRWEDEKQGERIIPGKRFLSADRQEDYYPWIIRGVRANGASRIYECGEARTDEDLEAIRIKWGVLPNCTMLDISFEFSESLGICKKYGWTGMRGSQMESFIHILEVREGGKIRRMQVKRAFSPLRYGDPHMGTKDQIRNRGNLAVIRQKLVRYYEWSNLSIKNAFAALISGRSSLYYGVAANIGEKYHEHLNSEVRYRIVDSKGQEKWFWSNAGRDGKGTKKPNHWKDGELQVLAAMAIQGMIPILTSDADAQDVKEEERQAA